MTVEELIKKLQNEDPKALVIVEGVDKGVADFTEAVTIEQLEVFEVRNLNTIKHYNLASQYDPYRKKAIVLV